MGELWSSTLLALASDVLPELREQRNRYYSFWNLIAAVAILGWIIVLVLFRVRSLSQPALAGLIGFALALGAGLGCLLWTALSDYSWGDMGVGSRWSGELAACMLG